MFKLFKKSFFILVFCFVTGACGKADSTSAVLSTQTPSPISTLTQIPTLTPSPTATPTLRNWRWSNALTTFNDMAVISGSEVWIIGQNGIIIHNKPKVMHLTNPYDYPGEYNFAGGGYLSSVDFISENDGWLTAFGGQIFHWDGLAWTASVPFSFENPVLQDIDFANTNIGWSVGCYRNGNSDIAVILQWNGKSWKNIPLSGEVANEYCLTDIDVLSETDAWVIGDKYLKALLLHWDGFQWQDIQLPPEFKSNFGANSVSAISPTNVWILGENTVSHWNGSVWKTDKLPFIFWYSENTSASPVVLALSPDNVWVGGRSLFRWNGNNWINANYETDYDYIVAIEADSDGNIWALTMMGRILQLSEEAR